jgi:hypothetical protein
MDPWIDVGVDTMLVPVASEPVEVLLPALDAAVAVIERYSGVVAPAGESLDG